MILSTLDIENFGPYAGKHEIDLSVSPDAPVVLIHADNMRGKTSLLNAIRWALYGHAMDRRNQPMPSHSFLSYDAREHGEYFMRVRLVFQHGEHEWELQRHHQWDQEPSSDTDPQEELSLQRDGKFVARQEIPETIAEIIHEDISRFFLFDAEMLGQYEVLLGEPGRDADLVKSSIEQILGVPALLLAVEDLQELSRDTEERHLKLAAAKEKNKDLTDKAKELKEARDAIEEDIKRLEDEHSKAATERDQLADRLEGFSEALGDMRALDDIDDDIAEVQAEQDQGLTEVVELISSRWWLPAAKSFAGRAESVANEIAALAARQAEAASLSHDEQQVEAGLEDGKCSACGHAISDHEREVLTAHLDEIRQRRKAAAGGGDLAGQLAELVIRQKTINQFAAGDDLGRLVERDRAWRRERIRISKKQREAERIRTRLREHPREAIRSTEIKHEKAIRALQSLESNIQSRREDLSSKQAALEKIQKRIAKLPDADPRTTLEFEVYPALTKLFQDGVDEFRAWLRNEVEREASDVFLRLTTEPDYTGLKINDQFGLEIMAEGDRLIAERSAGAEQVVALSLIAGLNRCTGKHAPVVMDTPFGRLDEKHGKNILEFLPTLADQVILLVQPRELNRERDLPVLADEVAREYQIVRDGSPTKSRIESI